MVNLLSVSEILLNPWLHIFSDLFCLLVKLYLRNLVSFWQCALPLAAAWCWSSWLHRAVFLYRFRNKYFWLFFSAGDIYLQQMYFEVCAKFALKILQILQTYIWATCKYFKHLNTFLCQINRWAHPMKVCALVNVHKIVFRWYIRLTFCIFLVFVFCNQYIFDFVCTSIVFRWYIHPGAIAKTTGAWCKG